MSNDIPELRVGEQAFVAAFVEKPDQPSDRPHRRVFAWCVACVGVTLVALAVLAHRVPFFAIDLAITRLVQSAQVAWIGPILHPLNVLGFPPLVTCVYGAIILSIFAAGARWEAVALGFATLGGAGLNLLVKEIVARPRPPAELVHVAHHLPDFGFPAGHVLNVTAFVGLLCYLTSVRLAPSWPRTALIAMFVATIALMGVARIYAGEHWPSDVLGGYLLGLIWLATTVEFYRWGRRRGRRRQLEHASRSSRGIIEGTSPETVTGARRSSSGRATHR